MKDLQPVAYLLSVCLVIAAFYVNPVNGIAKINLTNILMASLFFFFAYIGLFYFKRTDFPLFLYFGESSLIFGAVFIFYAFTGIVEIIDRAPDATNTLYVTVFVYSFFLISIMFLSGKVKKALSDEEKIALLDKEKKDLLKKEKKYSLCRICFHLSLVIFCFYIFLFLVGLLSGFRVFILSLITLIFNRLVLITLSASLITLVDLYQWELISRWKNNLSNNFKNADTFSINPVESLKVVATPLVNFGLPMIGLSLLFIGFWLLLSAFGYHF